MKKFLVAMAAVLAMTATVSAKDSDNKGCPDAGKCTKQEQCQKGDKKCDQGFCPFDGLNLTDAQKAQIQELRKSCAEQQKADKQQKKESKKEARKECKTQMLAQLKTILTPEQYVQFLENSFVNGGQQGRQQGKQGQQGQRGERGERPQQ